MVKVERSSISTQQTVVRVDGAVYYITRVLCRSCVCTCIVASLKKAFALLSQRRVTLLYGLITKISDPRSTIMSSSLTWGLLVLNRAYATPPKLNVERRRSRLDRFLGVTRVNTAERPSRHTGFQTMYAATTSTRLLKMTASPGGFSLSERPYIRPQSIVCVSAPVPELPHSLADRPTQADHLEGRRRRRHHRFALSPRDQLHAQEPKNFLP